MKAALFVKKQHDAFGSKAGVDSFYNFCSCLIPRATSPLV